MFSPPCIIILVLVLIKPYRVRGVEKCNKTAIFKGYAPPGPGILDEIKCEQLG